MQSAVVHTVQQALVDLELCNVFLIFEYVDEIVKCDHSIEKHILAWATGKQKENWG